MKDISILGRTIQIKLLPRRELMELTQSEDLMGWYDANEQIIFLYAGLEGEAFKRTMLHEITHAMISISGLSNVLKEKHEEAVCDLMESFLELFKNRKFIDYLQE